MIIKPSREKARAKRHYKMRRYLSGTPSRPRLAVYRSNKHIYAQVIDDEARHTIAAASTMEKSLVEASGLSSTSNIAAAKAVGGAVAKRAMEKGVEKVVFDRGGYIYHGRVKELAEAARAAGLEF